MSQGKCDGREELRRVLSRLPPSDEPHPAGCVVLQALDVLGACMGLGLTQEDIDAAAEEDSGR